MDGLGPCRATCRGWTMCSEQSCLAPFPSLVRGGVCSRRSFSPYQDLRLSTRNIKASISGWSEPFFPRQKKILLDEAELGLMQCMVTVTSNDASGELTACCRRGPFAAPNKCEQIDYLLSRKRVNRASSEEHSVYHVVAYQRRLNYLKQQFFWRGYSSPLGRVSDWWDRTEAFRMQSLNMYKHACPPSRGNAGPGGIHDPRSAFWLFLA